MAAHDAQTLKDLLESRIAKVFRVALWSASAFERVPDQRLMLAVVQSLAVLIGNGQRKDLVEVSRSANPIVLGSKSSHGM